MSVLVVGLSHASAPVAILERAVVTGEAKVKLLHDLRLADHIAGSLVLSTCNRVEVYAEVDRFHGGVTAICDLLARHSGLSLAELTGPAYVHYEDRAAEHLLTVACGLDSMVVGESQILGQVRDAVRLARQHGTLSRELSDLARLALRAGRRAHAETGIDAAGQNLVMLGVQVASRLLERGPSGGAPLSGLSVLVVGAGSMSSLAVATARRHGAGQIVIANRTRARAERLAARYGATVASMPELPASIAAADLVISCTGATGHVITAAIAERALRLRSPGGRGPLVLLDLALPRDVEAAAAALPGVRLVSLEDLGPPGGAEGAGPGAPGSAAEAEVAAVRRIMAAELAEYLRASRAASVAPTVAALRAKATSVVESELARLQHGPTVRVKELAGAPGADSYEAALRVLFELDPGAVRSVGAPSGDLLAAAGQAAEEEDDR